MLALLLCLVLPDASASPGPDAWAAAKVELADLDDAEARRAWVEARVRDGQRGLAEVACRRRVQARPEDPDAWVLLARVVDAPLKADRLAGKALALEPHHVGARLVRGEALLSLGEPDEAAWMAETVLAVQTDAEAWLLLARSRWALGDDAGAREAARAATAVDPSLSEVWALRARLGEAEVLSTALEHHPDDPTLWALQAAAHLQEGTLGPATAALARARQLDPNSDEVARLSLLLGCLQQGTLDPAGHAALEDNRLAGLVGEPAVAIAGLVARYPDCAAPWTVRAAHRYRDGDLDGAAADLQQALSLRSDHSLAQAAYGLVLVEAGRLEEARPWLERAAAARPWDGLVAVGLARVLRDAGEALEAHRVLERAWQAGARRPDVALALAEDTPHRGDALDVVLAALDRAPGHALLLRRAEELAPVLGRDDEVAARVDTLAELQETQDAPPPWWSGVDEEVVVLGRRRSDQLRDQLGQRLQELGFDEGIERGDRTVYRRTHEYPAVTVFHDGRLRIQRSGYLALEEPLQPGFVAIQTMDGTAVPEVGLDSPLPQHLNRRRMGALREEVLDHVGPLVKRWRDTLSLEGTREALQERIPDRVDALWHRGVPLGGGPVIETRAERRAALLDYWATRTCTPPGEAVRDWVEGYLRHEVQDSAWPVTEAEVRRASAACACGELGLSGAD